MGIPKYLEENTCLYRTRGFSYIIDLSLDESDITRLDLYLDVEERNTCCWELCNLDELIVGFVYRSKGHLLLKAYNSELAPVELLGMSYISSIFESKPMLDGASLVDLVVDSDAKLRLQYYLGNKISIYHTLELGYIFLDKTCPVSIWSAISDFYGYPVQRWSRVDSYKDINPTHSVLGLIYRHSDGNVYYEPIDERFLSLILENIVHYMSLLDGSLGESSIKLMKVTGADTSR